jgi:1-acyl-sn-glycerol-3-phosphate acyltransferase
MSISNQVEAIRNWGESSLKPGLQTVAQWTGESLALSLEAVGAWVNGSLAPWIEAASATALYWLGRAAVDFYLKTVLRQDVHWHAALPEGPKIVAANHPTTTDPFYILALIPEQVHVLVTGGAFTVPGFGAYLERTGHVPVVRNSGGATVEAARRLLEAGQTIVIFPEGALSPLEGALSPLEGSIGFHQAHSGVARLALSTGAPVIPVGIGLQPALIRFLEVELDGRPEMSRLYLHGRYATTVGKARYFEGNADDRAQVRAVSGQIMDIIARLSRESTARIGAAQLPASPLAARPLPI